MAGVFRSLSDCFQMEDEPCKCGVMWGGSVQVCGVMWGGSVQVCGVMWGGSVQVCGVM